MSFAAPRLFCSYLLLGVALCFLSLPAEGERAMRNEGGAEGRFVGRQGIESLLFQSLQNRYWQGRYQQADIKLDPLARDFPAKGLARIEALLWDKRTKRFSAHLSVRAAMAGSPAKNEKRFSLTGSAVALVSVISLHRARSRGDRLRRGDIVVLSLPASRSLQNVFSEVSSVLDKEVRYRLKAGTILRSPHLSEARLVRRRRPVLVFYESDGLRMSVRGLALEDGVAGQSIRVRNKASGLDVEGIVVGEGRVAIQSIEQAPPITPEAVRLRRHALDNPFSEGSAW